MLVGHSYGGVVITEAGNNAKVAGLVMSRGPRRTSESPLVHGAKVSYTAPLSADGQWHQCADITALCGVAVG
jgi:hypothetical protein